jgi:Mg-chelatase subunit ChlI
MKQTIIRALTAATLMALAGGVSAASMSKQEHKAAKAGAESEYKLAKATCGSLSANAKDICMAEAKGREKVALAEIEAAYKPTAKNRDQVRLAKAQAIHAVAVQKCDDMAGNPKDVCVKQADATHTAAKADVKANKQVAEARKDASIEKRDAAYSVAREKCDALAGDPKDACVKEAKLHHGKS